MCELYCPANAIYVAPDQNRAETIDPDGVRASGEPGSLRRGYGWDHAAASNPLDDFWQLGPLLREGADIAARRHATRMSEAPASTEPG